MKQMSDYKKSRINERADIIERVRIKYPICALSSVYWCNSFGDSLDVDEQIPKSDWREAEYTFANCWCLCNQPCHHNKHHVHPRAAMIIGLYGRQRMLRYDLTIEDRLDAFDEFRDGDPFDEDAAKVFLHAQLNNEIDGFKGW